MEKENGNGTIINTFFIKMNYKTIKHNQSYSKAQFQRMWFYILPSDFSDFMWYMWTLCGTSISGMNRAAVGASAGPSSNSWLA